MKKFLTALVCAAALLCFGCKEDDGGDEDNAITLQISKLDVSSSTVYGYTSGLSYTSSGNTDIYTGSGYEVSFTVNTDGTWNICYVNEYKDGTKQTSSLGYTPVTSTTVTVTKSDGKVSFTTGNIEMGLNVAIGTLSADKVFKLVCNNVTYSE